MTKKDYERVADLLAEGIIRFCEMCDVDRNFDRHKFIRYVKGSIEEYEVSKEDTRTVVTVIDGLIHGGG